MSGRAKTVLRGSARLDPWSRIEEVWRVHGTGRAELRRTTDGFALLPTGRGFPIRVRERRSGFDVEAAEWHGRANAGDDVSHLVEALLSGRARVMVTYRGDLPVRAALEVLGADGAFRERDASETLVKPFWRRRRIEERRY